MAGVAESERASLDSADEASVVVAEVAVQDIYVKVTDGAPPEIDERVLCSLPDTGPLVATVLEARTARRVGVTCRTVPAAARCLPHVVRYTVRRTALSIAGRGATRRLLVSRGGLVRHHRRFAQGHA